jgi:hypothetical protein
VLLPKQKTVGTILEVTLAQPILPNTKTTFTLDFEGQVPVQIRRSRNNSEGVALSMTQWYPKIAEFDFEGCMQILISLENFTAFGAI